MSSTPKVQRRILAAFDFDHTLVELNTDAEVQRLSPGGKLPEEPFKNLRQSLNWQEYMQKVFDHLHQNKVSSQAIKTFIRSLAFTFGCGEMLKSLKEDLNADIIIISDSNTIFIEELLQESGYCKYVDKVFTHPAYACPDTDRLVISQLNPGVVCPKRPGHMCKGSILTKYIDDQGGYDLVAYTGDGTNDFCPMTNLRAQDHAFVRQGFSLEKTLSKPENREELKCKVTQWSDLSGFVSNLRQTMDENLKNTE